MSSARRTSGVRTGAIAAAVGAFLAAGCAAVFGSGPDPAALAGCYEFQRDGGAEALGLPWGLLLRDEPLEDEWLLMEGLDDVHSALTLESAARWIDHPFGYWRPMRGDSLEVGHPGGGGVVLTLAVEPEEEVLSGRGRDVGDAVAPEAEIPGRESYPVRLGAVECGRAE